VQKPHKGCSGRDVLRCISGKAKREPIETLRRRRVRRAIARICEACERRPEEIQAKAFAARPREANPMGGASSGRAKTPCGCKALSGGMNPATEVRRAGLALRRQKHCRTNGTWVRFQLKGCKTSREVKPPKGESQERCRCETKPARDPREETVKRVAKP